MSFVRWHYRDGVYVRSHYRRGRGRVSTAQVSLLPVLCSGTGATTTPSAPAAPARSARRSRRSAAHFETLQLSVALRRETA